MHKIIIKRKGKHKVKMVLDVEDYLSLGIVLFALILILVNVFLR